MRPGHQVVGIKHDTGFVNQSGIKEHFPLLPIIYRCTCIVARRKYSNQHFFLVGSGGRNILGLALVVLFPNMEQLYAEFA